VRLRLFHRVCRGCGLLFLRWEKHDYTACLKRREWRRELEHELAARWESARKPIRDTKKGFVWAVTCECGSRSVELTEDGAKCQECGRAL